MTALDDLLDTAHTHGHHVTWQTYLLIANGGQAIEQWQVTITGPGTHHTATANTREQAAWLCHHEAYPSPLDMAEAA